VQVTDPTVTTADANSLGITEVIGVGRSNFAGSPKNRRANIHTGAAKLNGIIIKPDEEFSLIAALGDINQATGYLPELVIKGNQTVPEYGGGLCQIGTTTFRAALATGLPIVERRNHSYRVTYYEPAGTDATIYDPKPDFRFKNDTGHAILIQTAIEGDNLVFEFWGTSDQRAVVQTKPVLSNFVAPPPTKLIETEDLPVGTKKCTEKPHVGADAQFTYTVTYPDGRVASEVFKSHYVPWREVCLIGVPKGTLQPTAPAPDAAPGALPSADTLGAQGN
jgi:vancomycin resistance protein YoaR